jgi:putative ABC transport system permease protein
MESILADIRYGLRILLKQPGFTLVAVITLALGIGANTAIFSLVNSILLRPLPFREPDRLVRMLQASPMLGLASWGVSQADFAAYREQNRSFESIAIFSAAVRIEPIGRIGPICFKTFATEYACCSRSRGLR